MPKFSIGRSSGSDITVDEYTVSRTHAELETGRDGRVTLRDLGSSYGTTVNRDGEWVTVGETAMDVAPDAAVRLGKHETSIGALTALAIGNTPDEDPTVKPPAVDPKPADAAPAASPKPASPKPASPKPAVAAATASGSGNNSNKWILIGGGVLLACVVVAAVLIIALGGSDRPSSASASRTVAKKPEGGMGDSGFGRDDSKKPQQRPETKPRQRQQDGGPQRPRQGGPQQGGQQQRRPNQSEGDGSQTSRAQIFRRIVSQCIAGRRYSRAQCVCAGRTIVTGLSADELNIMERMNASRNKQETLRQLIAQYGQAKVFQMTQKFQLLTRSIMQNCGFNPNAR